MSLEPVAAGEPDRTGAERCPTVVCGTDLIFRPFGATAVATAVRWFSTSTPDDRFSGRGRAGRLRCHGPVLLLPHRIAEERWSVEGAKRVAAPSSYFQSASPGPSGPGRFPASCRVRICRLMAMGGVAAAGVDSSGSAATNKAIPW
jgi:hypothetical protein